MLLCIIGYSLIDVNVGPLFFTVIVDFSHLNSGRSRLDSRIVTDAYLVLLL